MWQRRWWSGFMGAVVLLAVPVVRAEETYKLDIPSLAVAEALQTFAEQSGLQIVYYAKFAEGKLANPVTGTFSAKEALGRLLENTGLTFEEVDERTVAIRTAESAEKRTSANDMAEMRIARADAPQAAQGQVLQQSTESAQEPKASSSEGMVLEEVIVTGTHIRGSVKPVSPLLVIDAAQIERTGYSSTQDLFESLPQNFGGGASADSDFSTGGTLNDAAGTGVNLRGLGTSSTLVLLNGHRVAPSASGSFVDISTIPLSAIERVEILTDGSSAIYGSDAVGGVVNILLKDSFEGVEARARYGTVSDGGRDEKLYALSAGTDWSGGGMFIGAQYQSLDALYTDERAVASLVPRPATLLPFSGTKNVTVSGRQRIGEDLKISADVLFARRDVDSVGTNVLDGFTQNGAVDQKNLNAALNLDYTISDRWSIRVSGIHGRQRSNRHQARRSDGILLDTSSQSALFKTTSAEVLSNLSLWAGRAGTAALALGGAVRRESLDSGGLDFGAFEFERRNRREITSGFGEIYVPLVGPENKIRGVKDLQLSAAVRSDHYSDLDIGSTTNPYFGLRWAINDAWAVRASQSRSFRAPVALETNFALSDTTLFALPPGFFVTPAGADAGVFFINGSRSDLQPERAKTWAFGVEFAATSALRFGLNYYDIAYRDRIVFPPLDFEALVKRDVYGAVVADLADDAAAEAFLNQMLAQGAIFNDFTGIFTGVNTGAAGVRYLLDLRQQNVAELDQKGYDLTVDYRRKLNAGTLTLGANATSIRSILTGFAGGTRRSDQVGTNGNPPELRARLDAGFDAGRWSLDASINYVDDYTNTSVVPDVPVASWTTVDLAARLSLDAWLDTPLLKHSTLSLSVQNAFDAAPPLVDLGLLFPDFVRYDAANANPVGRFVALEIRTAW